MESALIEVDSHLTKKQKEYEQQLSRRAMFEQQIGSNKKSINSVLNHMGYSKTKDNLLFELGATKYKIKENKDAIKR